MYKLDKNVFAIHSAVFFKKENKMRTVRFANCLQNIFDGMFSDEPQILPVPDDAPADVPRLVFKNDKSASIIVTSERIDFDAGIILGKDWRKTLSIITKGMLKACDNLGLDILRIGIVIQAKDDGTVNGKLNECVKIKDFKESEEKNIQFVYKTVQQGINLNIITAIVINKNDEIADKKVIIDANSDKNNESVIEIENANKLLEILLDKIKEKLENVI